MSPFQWDQIQQKMKDIVLLPKRDQVLRHHDSQDADTTVVAVNILEYLPAGFRKKFQVLME